MILFNTLAACLVWTGAGADPCACRSKHPGPKLWCEDLPSQGRQVKRSRLDVDAGVCGDDSSTVATTVSLSPAPLKTKRPKVGPALGPPVSAPALRPSPSVAQQPCPAAGSVVESNLGPATNGVPVQAMPPCGSPGTQLHVPEPALAWPHKNVAQPPCPAAECVVESTIVPATDGVPAAAMPPSDDLVTQHVPMPALARPPMHVPGIPVTVPPRVRPWPQHLQHPKPLQLQHLQPQHWQPPVPPPPPLHRTRAAPQDPIIGKLLADLHMSETSQGAFWQLYQHSNAGRKAAVTLVNAQGSKCTVCN